MLNLASRLPIEKLKPALDVLKRRRVWLLRHWPAFFVALHFAKIIYLFRDIRLSHGLPLLNADYILYYTRAVRTGFFVSASTRMWGYDPYQMAGYVSGPIHELGSTLMSLMAFALRDFMPVYLSLLGLEVAALALSPLLLVPTVRNLGGTRRQAWSAFAVAAVFFGTFEPITHLILKYGLFAFVTGCFAAVWLMSHFWKWLRNPGLVAWLVLTAASTLIIQFHPGLLFVLMPMPLMYVLKFRDLRPLTHLLVASMAATALSANWYWIEPYVYFSDWLTPVPYAPSLGTKGMWQSFGFIQPNVSRSLNAILNLGLLMLAALGLSRGSRLTSGLRWILAGTTLWMVVIGYFGSSLRFFNGTQPGRYVFPLFLFFCIAAGFGLKVFLSYGASARRLGNALGSVAVVVGLFVWVISNSKPDTAMRTSLPTGQMELVTHLATRGPIPGRLLLETVDSTFPHFSELLPIVSNQHVLGGPNPGVFMKTRSTVFSGTYIAPRGFVYDAPIAFGKPLKKMSENEFLDYLSLYNVSAVAAQTPDLIRVLARTKGLRSTGRYGIFELFDVKEPSGSWFYRGDGDLTVGYDKISIGYPTRGILVLKFHWIQGMRSTSDIPVRPVYLADDPVPFILVDNAVGASAIEVWNGEL